MANSFHWNHVNTSKQEVFQNHPPPTICSYSENALARLLSKTLRRVKYQEITSGYIIGRSADTNTQCWYTQHPTAAWKQYLSYYIYCLILYFPFSWMNAVTEDSKRKSQVFHLNIYYFISSGCFLVWFFFFFLQIFMFLTQNVGNYWLHHIPWAN